MRASNPSRYEHAFDVHLVLSGTVISVNIFIHWEMELNSFTDKLQAFFERMLDYDLPFKQWLWPRITGRGNSLTGVSLHENRELLTTCLEVVMIVAELMRM